MVLVEVLIISSWQYWVMLGICQIFSQIQELEDLPMLRRVKVLVLSIAGFYAGSLIVQYAFGDFYIFIICAFSCLVAFIYGILRIENIIPEKEIDGDNVVEVILKVIIYILILDILYRKELLLSSRNFCWFPSWKGMDSKGHKYFFCAWYFFWMKQHTWWMAVWWFCTQRTDLTGASTN